MGLIYNKNQKPHVEYIPKHSKKMGIRFNSSSIALLFFVIGLVIVSYSIGQISTDSKKPAMSAFDQNPISSFQAKTSNTVFRTLAPPIATPVIVERATPLVPVYTSLANTVFFANKYGTSTTRCNHSGCSNFIASSGDTNCCTWHSSKCHECGCFIDEDAYYCIACIEEAAAKVITQNKSSTSSYSSTVKFTNKYGSSTTRCAHPGCTNYIASSGDSNCCTVHSNQCIECGCYIDEDAGLCMSCIEKAIRGY